MNKIILIGNLTKDPELTTTAGGISVAKFGIAVNRRFKNADGKREVDFINCVAWRDLGERIHEWLQKGSKCAVEGTLQIRSYETQDGERRYVTEVVCDNVEFLSTKTETEKKNNDNYKQTTIDDNDDLPF